MESRLSRLIIKICENLPLDFTLYEKDGFCKNSNKDCNYCKKYMDNIYFCNKKTYTFNPQSL